MARRSRLALHWKILIGLLAGLLVGLGLNLSWDGYTWGALGAGDPARYIAGKPGERATTAPPNAERAILWLQRALEDYSAAQGAGPIEAPNNAYSGRIVDWFLRPVLTEDSPPRRAPANARPQRQPVPVPEGVDITASVAWLKARTEEAVASLASGEPLPQIAPPEDDALASGVAWLISGLAQTEPNAEAGFAAWAPRFLANLSNLVGDLFLRLLTFIAVPVVLFSLIVGASSMTDIRRLGRIGSLTALIYLVTTIIAIVVGLLLVNVVRPGEMVSPEVRDTLAASRFAEGEARTKVAAEPNFWAVILNAVPRNPFGAIAASEPLEMLQVVVAAILIGLSLGLLPDGKGKPAIAVCESLNEAMLKIVGWIMALAPFAVFALIARTVATTGLGALSALGAYMGVVIGGLAILMFVEYPILLKFFSKMGIRRFYRGIIPAQLTAFSTSSSNASIAVSMQVAEERLGIPRTLTSFVMPLGATISMDGTALYQAVASVFICQLYGIDLTIAEQLSILLMATLAAIGTPGVPGVGLLMIIVILEQVGVVGATTAGGIAVILGVDRVLDMCRTTLNVTVDMVTASIVATREGVLMTEEEVEARLAAKSDADRFSG